MPANVHLMSGLGGGGIFRLAQSCPVAETYGSGGYMSHQGGDDFMIADAATRGQSAAVRIVAWRCVYCGVLVVGLGAAEGEPDADQEFTWLEQEVAQPGGGAAGPAAPGGPPPGS